MRLLISVILTLAGHAGGAMATPSFEDARGSFRQAVAYPVGANPFSVARGDFNGDGKVDLAVGNWDGDSVSILLGTGGGAFASKVDYAVGDGAQTVAVADFNGDLKLDLAVANIWSHDVSVLLGTGTGTFSTSVQYAAGVNPRSVAVGDFNADGKPDLVVPNGSSGNISVLLGVGNGTFAAATHFEVGGGAISVAIGDFNGDGKPDLAVANQQSNTVSILPGTGAGNFGAANNIAVGTDPTSVASGDFNADGKLDLAVTNLESGNVSLLIGTGGGNFNAATPVTAGPRPIFVAAGDLNGDGRPELAVANESADTVSILLGSASGAFGSPTGVHAMGQVPRSVAIGDLDNDGLPDLAVVNAVGGDVSILLGEIPPVLEVRPIGNIDATSSHALRRSTLWIDRQALLGGWPFAHAAYADFNKDGRVDFVRTFSDNTISRPVQFMRNDGAGNFSDQTATMLTGTQPGVTTTRKILTGDYNGDGWPDVFILNHGLDFPPWPGEHSQLFLSNGNGTLRYVPGLEPYAEFNHGGASGDIDGNGTVDVLVANPTQPYFLLNDGQGNLTRNWNRLPAEIARGAVYTAELMDVDQDGFIDLMVGGSEADGLGTTIYWGSASGYYRASSKVTLPGVAGWTTVWDFIAADLDGDGWRDLVVYRVPTAPDTNGRYLQILRQTAARVFADETATRMSMDTTQPATDFFRVQDLDGDGDRDIFIDDRSFVTQGDYAWINNGLGVFAPYAGPVSALAPAPDLSITDVSVIEGNGGSKLLTFTVGLSSTGPTAVTYSIATSNNTATAGSDYVARSLSGETIPAGQASRTFTVTINGDAVLEPNETFIVTVANVVGATVSHGTAIGTINNDDTSSSNLSVNDMSLNEGDSGTKLLTFTATLSQAAPVAVTFNANTVDGSAVGGADFTVMAFTGLTIPAGQLSRTFSVPVKGELVVEPLEYFHVNLSGVSGANLVDAQGIGYIINNDGALITISDIAMGEGHAGTKLMTFTVKLSKVAAGPVTYNIYSLDANATAGSDYVALNLTGQTIPQGQLAKTHTVTINGDTTIEETEVVLVNVRQPVGASVWDGQGTGFILNDDGPTLSIPDASVGEGASGTKVMNATVFLSQVAAVPVTFTLASANVSATAGSDYVALNGSTVHTIPAGQTSKAFQITVNGDTTIEQNESFTLTLGNATGATLYDRQAIATIYNDDGPTLWINNATVTEGDAGTKLATFTVTLTKPAAVPISYNVATSNVTATAGSDYVARSLVGETIPAGQLSKTFTVTINGDTAVEANETFRATLSNISAGATLLVFTGTGTITNDD
jgi:hypothetical protein